MGIQKLFRYLQQAISKSPIRFGVFFCLATFAIVLNTMSYFSSEYRKAAPKKIYPDEQSSLYIFMKPAKYLILFAVLLVIYCFLKRSNENYEEQLLVK